MHSVWINLHCALTIPLSTALLAILQSYSVHLTAHVMTFLSSVKLLACVLNVVAGVAYLISEGISTAIFCHTLSVFIHCCSQTFKSSSWKLHACIVLHNKYLGPVFTKESWSYVKERLPPLYFECSAAFAGPPGEQVEGPSCLLYSSFLLRYSHSEDIKHPFTGPTTNPSSMALALYGVRFAYDGW